MEQLDSTLADYEAKVTGPFIRLEEEAATTGLEKQEIILRSRFDASGSPVVQGTAADAQRANTVRAELRQLFATAGACEKRIATLNAEFLPKILRELPPDKVPGFRAEYMRRAYPTIYPDATRPTEDPASLLRRLGAPQDIRLAVDEIWAGYDRAYEHICLEMRQMEDEWYFKIAETQDWTGVLEHREALKVLAIRRTSLTEQTLRQIIALTPPDLVDGVRGWSGLRE
jgi:hypothetical protein